VTGRRNMYVALGRRGDGARAAYGVPFVLLSSRNICLLTFFFWVGSIFVDEFRGNSDTCLQKIRAITILNPCMSLNSITSMWAGRYFEENMLVNLEYMYALLMNFWNVDEEKN
jgi:hypothetical protein